MTHTIKGKIQTQIYLNHHLLNYDDSDSSQSSQEEIILEELTVKVKAQPEPQNKTMQHEKMITKRRQVLKQLENQNKHNLPLRYNEQYRPLKNSLKQPSATNENKIILELKAKLAQILKESQQKSSKIKQFQQNSTRNEIHTNELECLLNERQNELQHKDQQLRKAHFQNKKLTEEYRLRIQQIEEELSKIIEEKNQSISEAMETIQMSKKRLNQLENLLSLKNQEINQVRKYQSKERKCISQNKKLKQDVNRLLTILESCNQDQIMQKSHKKIIQSKLVASKFKNTRSISLSSQKLSKHTKTKANDSISKLMQCNNVSLIQKSLATITENRTSLWFPSFLINQVQKFLKKWHIAQNNQKFVNNLVEFINEYTEKCVSQNKSRMESQYKSLKKQIRRKANQSLAFQQVMKERELKIKLNINKSQTRSSQKSKSEFKGHNMTLSQDNVSILVPASNKKNSDKQGNRLLSMSLLDNNIQKDDIGYNNLQKSIRLHHKKSANKMNEQISSDEVNTKIAQMLKKHLIPHRKSKTQTSIDLTHKFLMKKQINSSNKKRSQSLRKTKTFL